MYNPEMFNLPAPLEQAANDVVVFVGQVGDKIIQPCTLGVLMGSLALYKGVNTMRSYVTKRREVHTLHTAVANHLYDSRQEVVVFNENDVSPNILPEQVKEDLGDVLLTHYPMLQKRWEDLGQ